MLAVQQERNEGWVGLEGPSGRERQLKRRAAALSSDGGTFHGPPARQTSVGGGKKRVGATQHEPFRGGKQDQQAAALNPANTPLSHSLAASQPMNAGI